MEVRNGVISDGNHPRLRQHPRGNFVKFPTFVVYREGIRAGCMFIPKGEYVRNNNSRGVNIRLSFRRNYDGR